MDPYNRFNLSGKLVLVTGSTQGIGKAAAEALIGAGARVFINGRKESVVNEVVGELNKKKTGTDGEAIPLVADVSTAEGVETLSKIVHEIGFLDVLVHNMGIFGVTNFFDLPDEEWLKYFNVNVMSTVRLCRIFLKPMLERNQGRVVIVSSECGIRGFPSMPQYAMTKACQINLMMSLAGLAKGTKVTVNCVLPGPTWTEGVEKYMHGVAEKDSKSVEQAISDYFSVSEPTSLIRRYLNPEEIANTVTFLASDASSGITGSAMRVDGGMIQHP